MSLLKKALFHQKKFQKNYNKKLLEIYNQYKDCSEEIHKYFHNLRDNVRTKNYYEKEQSNENYIEQLFKNICSDIESIFNILWKGEKVSVCIKRIVDKNQTHEENDFKKWEIETIARSRNTKPTRNKDNKKPVKIGDNSDFLIIISPNYADSVFSCMDLTKVNDEFLETYEMPYRNSTENYIKNYESTIVVPIRIQVDKINPQACPKWMKGNDYHLVGFLCIDTEKKFAGCPAQFDAGIELAKACADMLYILIENMLVLPSEDKVEACTNE